MFVKYSTYIFFQNKNLFEQKALQNIISHIYVTHEYLPNDFRKTAFDIEPL